MKTTFICDQCKKEIVHESEFSTGYGIDKNNNKVCFACCGENDKNSLLDLKPKEKFYLYFDGKIITNWPGTLKILPTRITKGNHNMCGTRLDVYFKLGDKWFHGLNLGDNQVLRVNTIK